MTSCPSSLRATHASFLFIPRVLGHGCFDWLFIYLVLILVSCFVVLFSVLFCLQLSVVRPNRSQVARVELPCISVSYCAFAQEWFFKPQSLKKMCEGALRHRTTRELYSNNLRAVGPSHAQLKTKQNRKQDNKTRHKD